MLFRISSIEGKGLGLIAACNIAADQEIETATYVVIGAEERYKFRATDLGRILFVPDYGTDSDPEGRLVLGDMSLANHADPGRANAKVEWIESDPGRAVLVARRNITRGEEIAIPYANLQEYDTRQWANTARHAPASFCR